MKKVGEYPVNSTIIIDYSKEKPEVNFEYPEKDSQIKGLHNSSGIYLLNLMIVMILALFLIMLNAMMNPDPYVKECVIHQYEYEKEGSAFISGVMNCSDFDNNTISYEVTHNFQGFSVSRTSSFYDKYWYILLATLLMLIYFINPYLLKRFFVKTRIGNKLFPKWNRLIMNKKFSAEFTTCPDSKVIEIPLFSNIFMDYEADGEFGDYLQRVEIVPHPFNHHLRKRRKEIKEGNYYLWKTRFVFKEVPKTGYLKMRWT